MCGEDSDIPAELKDFILDLNGPLPFNANPLTSKDEFIKEAYEYIIEGVDQFNYEELRFSPPNLDFKTDFSFPDSPVISSSSSDYSSTQSFAFPPEYPHGYLSNTQPRMLSPPNFASNSSELTEFFPQMSSPPVQNPYFQVNENYENFNTNLSCSFQQQYYGFQHNNNVFDEKRKVFGSIENQRIEKKIKQKTKKKDYICSNCQTSETSLWRWNNGGQRECNACNIFEARNGMKRPRALRKDKILPRKRNPRTPQPANNNNNNINNNGYNVNVNNN